MPDKKDDTIFKKGIWIKEDKGLLIMGSLDEQNDISVVLSKNFSKVIFDLENELQEALYGEKSAKFNPKNVNIKNLFEAVADEINNDIIKSTVHCSDNSEIKGDYKGLYRLLSGLVKNSMDYELESVEEPFIYINASVLDNKLHVIYRDHGNCDNLNSLWEEIDYITNKMNGKIKLNTSGKLPYLDIMIPEKLD